MLDFIRKKAIWAACEKGYLDELKSKNISYQLKHAQDLAIYDQIRDLSGLRIAEIGGGNSRLLERIAMKNHCFNIEKFEGKDLGPSGELALKNVHNISAYVGDFDKTLADETFDVIFSISVVEHIETEKLDSFFHDSLRILKPGGRFLHAIDMYLQEDPMAYTKDRFDRYRRWFIDYEIVSPIGQIYEGPLKFNVDMITNPDNILYGWNKLVPSLAQLRAESQSVSLILGGIKMKN